MFRFPLYQFDFTHKITFQFEKQKTKQKEIVVYD